ncbi:hypothetical protein J6590_016123 [Homalodisca vitripennis]|nr:hypothetical protein J6590_016123 [Homalodisca vitripennis]
MSKLKKKQKLAKKKRKKKKQQKLTPRQIKHYRRIREHKEERRKILHKRLKEKRRLRHKKMGTGPYNKTIIDYYGVYFDPPSSQINDSLYDSIYDSDAVDSEKMYEEAMKNYPDSGVEGEEYEDSEEELYEDDEEGKSIDEGGGGDGGGGVGMDVGNKPKETKNKEKTSENESKKNKCSAHDSNNKIHPFYKKDVLKIQTRKGTGNRDGYKYENNKEGRNMSKVVLGYYMRQNFEKWLLIQKFAAGVLKPISRTQIEIDKKEAIIPISPTTPIIPTMNGVGWNMLTSVENNLGDILQMRLKRSVTRKKRKRKPRHKEAGKTLQRKRAKKRKQKQRRVERKRLRMLTHARRLRKQKKSKQARLERHYARMNMTTPFPGYIMNHTRENNTLLRKYDLNEQETSDTRQENTEEEYSGETYEDENEDSSHEESDEYSDENSADNGNDDYDDDDYDDSDEDEDDNSDYENIEYENVEDKPYKPEGDKSDNTGEKHHLQSAQVGTTKKFVDFNIEMKLFQPFSRIYQQAEDFLR